MNPQSALATRRTFLRGAGVALSLPWLESLGGIVHAAEAGKEPRRLLLICLPLGIYRDSLIPEQTGTSYELPEYLAPLADLRDRFTVVSGLEHPGVSVVTPPSRASSPVSRQRRETAARWTSMSPPRKASTHVLTHSH